MQLNYLELYNTHTNKITRDPSLVEHINFESDKLGIEYIHLKQRLWHLAHNQPTVPLCPVCSTNPIKWDKVNSSYTETCGRKCATKRMANDPATRAKIEATNLATYGVKAPAMNKTVYGKVIATKIEKHGADYGLKWKEKTQKTMIDKYGVNNPSHLDEFNDKKRQRWIEKTETQLADIKAKRVAANIEKYGVENPQQNPDVREKTVSTTLERYGAANAMQSPEVRARAEATNLERYGVTAPSMLPEIAEKIKQTNMLNHGGIHNTQQHLPTETLKLLDSKEWLYDQHVNQQLPISAISVIVGASSTTVLNKFHKFGLDIQRFSASYGERELSSLLTSNNVSHECNNRVILGGKELDIYIPDHNLAIEYCGLYWHSTAFDRITPSYHKHKLDLCEQKGVRLITLFEDEWAQKRSLVEQKILSILQLDNHDAIHARKCSIVNVSNNDKKQFFEAYHIQGDGPGSVTHGLMYDNKLVACMTWIKQANHGWVLNRYATSNRRVQGGFTKLLKHFQRVCEWNEIVSFADLRWSRGDLYRNNGFTLDKTLPPDYYWIVNGERQHKFNWRHSGRLKTLPQYDPSLSENLNMQLHGFHKMYNCGLQRWTLQKV